MLSYRSIFRHFTWAAMLITACSGNRTGGTGDGGTGGTGGGGNGGSHSGCGPRSCPTGTVCDPLSRECVEEDPGQQVGENCKELPCADGLVCGTNSLCCTPGETCCFSADECSIDADGNPYAGSVCTDPANCQGEVRAPTCVAGRCGSSVTPSADACDGFQCTSSSCQDGFLTSGKWCHSGGICGSGLTSHIACPDGFGCMNETACWNSCDGDSSGARCKDPAATCNGDTCSSSSDIGASCSDNAECQSGECTDGHCRGRLGDRCTAWGNVPIDGTYATRRCATGLVCGFGDPTGALFRCMPAACAEGLCNYWSVADDSCQPVGDFIGPFTGKANTACVGGTLTELACTNAADDDLDGVTDLYDPDCQKLPGPILKEDPWEGVSPGSLPVRAFCPGAESRCDTLCESGVGGCFDAECHSSICWPASCEVSESEAQCRWWDSIDDKDNSCDVGNIGIRPERARCGTGGCICELGTAQEISCNDLADNDRDGAPDNSDSDCQRAPGDTCFVGAPWLPASDQCAGDDVCWCSNKKCSEGKCLGADPGQCAQDWATERSAWCHYYEQPENEANGANCGFRQDRASGSVAWPFLPAWGHCGAGAVSYLEPGPWQNGDLCDDYTDCESGFCGCGDEECSDNWRRCVPFGNCAGEDFGNLCKYVNSAGECDGNLNAGMPCLGSAAYANSCVCGDGGVMREVACDNYFDDDSDGNPDWLDAQCSDEHFQEIVRRFRQ